MILIFFVIDTRKISKTFQDIGLQQLKLLTKVGWFLHSLTDGGMKSCSKCCKDPPAGGSLTLSGTGKQNQLNGMDHYPLDS